MPSFYLYLKGGMEQLMSILSFWKWKSSMSYNFISHIYSTNIQQIFIKEPTKIHIVIAMVIVYILKVTVI